MTVGFYSPLPPARTGVADYAAALLRQLRRRGRIEVDASRSDINLYHLGNNQLHAAVYERAIRSPGVVVLHDAVLHHFLLGMLTADEYVQEFVYNYGEWSRGLAESLWRTRARSGADHRYFRYPMLRRVCELSHTVGVHNPAAEAIVRSHAPKARIVEIPHLFERPSPANGADTERVRQRLGVGPGMMLAGIFGYLRESKRLMAVLRVLRRLGTNRLALLFAGDVGSRDLARAMQPFLVDARVRRLPYTADTEFWRIAHATDICINLRYPAAGETSGIMIRFMGIGKTVIATDAHEISRIPQAACLRVRPGVGEEAELEELLRWLIAMPQYAGDIGSLAAQHIAAHHDSDIVADLYWKTLCDARC